MLKKSCFTIIASMSQKMSKVDLFYAEYLKQKAVQPHVSRAVELIASFVNVDESATYVSFNGGKDATVVLYLTVLAYKQYILERCSLKLPVSSIKTLYFEQPHPFEEVMHFMDRTQELLGYHKINAQRNLPVALTKIKQSHRLKYVIMGSRKTDPYCSNLAEVCPSDTEKGYPQFDRINPILHWSYETIWGFLRGYDLMFCSLYEKGYTYLGNRHNSIQNPKIYDQSKDAFKPAWEASGDHELLSRKK